MQRQVAKIICSACILLLGFSYQISSAHALDINLGINPQKIKQDPAASKLEFKLLNLALKSYTKAKNDSIFAHKLKNNYLTIVDYRLASTEPRLWVIDLVNNRAGRSFGCLAVNRFILKDLITTIKNGTLIFSYYPEREWLVQSRFL